MKKFLALVLALVMTMSLVTIGASAKTDFTDDAKITNEEAVEVLNAMGVLTGYADGSFRPQATLTRGAGAKIIAYLVLGQTAADKLQATYTVFEDVTDGVGLAPYIEWAAAAGIVDGYGDGKFGPYNTLTEYAFGKMLLTALGYDSAKEGFTGAGWQKNVVSIAVKNGVFDGTESYGACDRETAARMALGAVQAKVVVYGDAIVAGSYYWNNNKVVVVGNGGIVKDQALETTKTLGDFYGVVRTETQDIFDRPGHSWSYKGWNKFYMDAPVAEYTTKVDGCTVLVDIGIAKTSKSGVDVEEYVNSIYYGEGRLDHKVCDEVVFGGQGVLTQVFATADGYRVTEIHTFLAYVKDTKAAEHSLIGDEAKLNVYYNDGSEDTKANNELVYVEDITGLTKGSYILVNVALDVDDEADYVAAEDYSIYQKADIDKARSTQITGSQYLNVVGDAKIFEGKLTAKTTDASMTLTIGGSNYGAARQYELTATGLTLGATRYWFVDQYGNVIGDSLTAAETPKYGRIDALKWVNDGDVTADEYVSANLVAADASQSVVTLGTWNGKTGAGADNWNSIGFFEDTYVVGEVKADNAKFYARSNKYGVVAYYSDYDVETAGKLLTSFDGKLTNGQVTLGKTQNGKKDVYADNSTQFLVYLGNGKYVAYTGINALPSMSQVTDVVYVADEYNGAKAYAEFVFVYAPNAIYAGATVEAYVYNRNYVKANSDGTYEYEVWVNGEKTTIVSTNANLFAVSGKLYHISFNADTVALSAVFCDCYSAVTVSQVGDGAVNNYNVSGATVYLIGESAISAYTAAEIEEGDTILIDAYATVIYVMKGEAAEW